MAQRIIALTEPDVPRCVPALDVLPLEQASVELSLGGHPGAGQLDFFLRKYPVDLVSYVMIPRAMLRGQTSWPSPDLGVVA